MGKVLLVADASWVVNDVHASLSMGDWEVVDLDDPARVVEVVDETDADAVIVDLQVDAMGGMAVIRELRAAFEDEARPRMILLLDRVADRFLARRAGADAAVLKPFTAQTLRQALGPGSPPAVPEGPAERETPARQRRPKAPPRRRTG